MTPEDFTTDPITLYAEVDGQEVEIGEIPELKFTAEMECHPNTNKPKINDAGCITYNIKLSKWQLLRLKFSIYKAMIKEVGIVEFMRISRGGTER